MAGLWWGLKLGLSLEYIELYDPRIVHGTTGHSLSSKSQQETHILNICRYIHLQRVIGQPLNTKRTAYTIFTRISCACNLFEGAPYSILKYDQVNGR